MVVTDLNATIYVDDFSLKQVPSSTTTPTPTSTPSLKNMTFEDGSLSGPAGAGIIAGTVSLENARPIDGIFSARIPNAGNSYLEERFAAVDDLFVFFTMRLTVLPASGVRIAQIGNGDITAGNLVLTRFGRLQLRNGTTQVGVNSSPLKVGVLYRIVLHQKKGTGGNAVLEALVAEGGGAYVSFGASTIGTWTTAATRLRVGATHATPLDTTLDDIVLRTAPS
jgi:hypothetical protein